MKWSQPGTGWHIKEVNKATVQSVQGFWDKVVLLSVRGYSWDVAIDKVYLVYEKQIFVDRHIFSTEQNKNNIIEMGGI